MTDNEGRQLSLGEIVAEHLGSNKVELPLFDETATRLQSMIQNREFEMDEVATLVQSDPALTGSLLRHSNAAFFGGIEKVVTVPDAIMRLGVKQVTELVILASQRQHYQLRDPMLQGLVHRLWRHAVGCGVGAKWLAAKLRADEVAEQAFLAGLLHDVGKLLLLRVLDDLEASGALPLDPSPTLVGQLLDGLHPEQGHALMQEWNIPDVYAQIVLEHELPEFDERNLLLAIVRLADKACNQQGIGLRDGEGVEVAASTEAQVLRVNEVMLAELEIQLEDAMELTG